MSFDLHQLLTLVGRLDDAVGSDTPRERFRRFLLDKVSSVGEVAALVAQSQERLGDQYVRARQDLVVLIGHYLGFEVTFGSYESVPGAVRLEGHWRSRRQARVAIEVRGEQTSAADAGMLARTLAALETSLPPDSGERWVGLCVSTEFDAGARQLEATLARRGVPDIRGISVSSLLWLADMATQGQVSHADALRLLTSGRDSEFMVGLMRRLMETTTRGEAGAVSASVPVVPRPAPVPRVTPAPPQLSIVARPEREGHTGFWLVTLLQDETATADQLFDVVIGRRQVLGLSDTGTISPREGDWVCFLTIQRGIVGDAQLDVVLPDASTTIRGAERFSVVFRLKNLRVYESARAIDERGTARRIMAGIPREAAGAVASPIPRDEYERLTTGGASSDVRTANA